MSVQEGKVFHVRCDYWWRDDKNPIKISHCDNYYLTVGRVTDRPSMPDHWYDHSYETTSSWSGAKYTEVRWYCPDCEGRYLEEMSR